MLGAIDNQFGIALLNRFKTAVPGIAMANRDVLFVPHDLAIRQRAERVGNDVLEFINFYRGSPEFPWNRNNTYASREMLPTHTEDGMVKGKKGLPADIVYEIAYWTRDKKNCNNFQEQYLFWLHENPTLPFVLESANIEHQMYMHFERPIETVHSWFDEGKYFTVRADIRVEAWIYKDLADYPVENTIFDIYVEGDGGRASVADPIVPVGRR